MEFKKINAVHKTDPRIPSSLGFMIDADAHFQCQNRFCVSDGVTRDLRNDDEFKVPKSLDEIVKTIRYYPNVFELRRLAEFFCLDFVSSNTKDISIILREINDKLRLYNDRSFKDGINYNGKNRYGVVAAGGIIEDDRLNCFNVSDSNIIVLDKYLDVISKTTDDYSDTEQERNSLIRSLYPDFDWNNNIHRSTFRVLFVNTNTEYSFGVLNGEDKAIHHINYYDFDLSSAEHILAYTDGFKEVIEDKKSREDYFSGKKLILQKEATMIGYKRVK